MLVKHWWLNILEYFYFFTPIKLFHWHLTFLLRVNSFTPIQPFHCNWIVLLQFNPFAPIQSFHSKATWHVWSWLFHKNFNHCLMCSLTFKIWSMHTKKNSGFRNSHFHNVNSLIERLAPIIFQSFPPCPEFDIISIS